MSSLAQTRSRMINQKKGVPTSRPDASQLANLKALLDDMYVIRNSTSNTICLTHTYRSYAQFMGSIGQDPNAASIGDYNRALDYMSDCICDSRTGTICDCVSRRSDNWCTCNSRSPSQCSCHSRTGSTYDSPCGCYSRTPDVCSCVSRTADITCTCHGRCSCNVVREFN